VKNICVHDACDVSGLDIRIFLDDRERQHYVYIFYVWFIHFSDEQGWPRGWVKGRPPWPALEMASVHISSYMFCNLFFEQRCAYCTYI
jgi:hypothetical protein